MKGPLVVGERLHGSGQLSSAAQMGAGSLTSPPAAAPALLCLLPAARFPRQFSLVASTQEIAMVVRTLSNSAVLPLGSRYPCLVLLAAWQASLFLTQLELLLIFKGLCMLTCGLL